MIRALSIAALTFAALALPAVAAGDAANGETVFKKCMACHAVGDGAKAKVGPVLNGLIGRTAGTVEGFKYSPAMVEAGAGGLIWDEATLTTYLKDPKGLVKGTKMALVGLKEDKDIADVIAYLATFTPAQ